MKDYIIITDFCLKARNRGTAALGYGAISFLREKGYIDSNTKIVSYHIHWSPFYKSYEYSIKVQGQPTKFKDIHINMFEYQLFNKLGVRIPFLPLGRMLKRLKCVAAINGGDGFSDIYGKVLYDSRNNEAKMAMKIGVPLVVLPQTIGPFTDPEILKEATCILKYASEVFVRDNKYTAELDRMGIKYEQTKDLSAYMKPEPWDIKIKPNSIGINVSGLAYSNKFLDLAGQFDVYPELIDRLICFFRDKGHTVYIIPHAYGYYNPETNNDDMIACREAYARLKDKSNVVLIDRDLISPQIKYVISQMKFFCGTRMHANFAAIYTGVPVFGLSYSYKFEGAFTANGLDAEKQTAMINNISSEDIKYIIEKIDSFYNESYKKLI